MGKQQTKKKTQRWRHNPIRVPDAHLGAGSGAGKVEAGKEKQMLPILQKLKSPTYADRTWACAAICNLVQNDAATRRLFQSKNVVGELIERLSDSVDEVVVEASGALRNLAIDGGHELCGEMFNKGIMAHLIVLMNKISHTIDSILSSNPETAPALTDDQVQARKHLLSLSENVISLVWCLAEASEKTLNAINGAGVEGLLIKVLDGREICGTGVALASAQALYSLSQDNPPFNKSLLHHPTALVSLAAICREDHRTFNGVEKKSKGKGKEANGAVDDGRSLLTRLLLCGVLRNIVQPDRGVDEHIDIRGLTNEVILPMINDLLDLNLDAVVTQVLQLAGQVPEQTISKTLDKNAKTDYRSQAELALDTVERTLSTVAVGLEILTGICAGVEDEEIREEPVEEVAEDDDEEMEDGLPDEDLIALARDNDVEANGDEATNSVNTASLPYLLTKLLLPQRLTALSLPNQLSFPPANNIPSAHPPTTAALSTIHLRALEALNNLLVTVAASLPKNLSVASQAASVIPLQGLWEGIFRIIEGIVSEAEVVKAKGQEMRLEILEMSIGCLWGVGKIGISQTIVTQNQIQILIELPGLLRTDLTKSRLLELLALIASRTSVTLEENKVISSWIMQQLGSPEANGELLVALLNAIIDIYSDETRDYDIHFIQGGYLDVLAGLVGRVRTQMKAIDRRKDRSLRVRGEEVYENLAAFVKYRRSLWR